MTPPVATGLTSLPVLDDDMYLRMRGRAEDPSRAGERPHDHLAGRVEIGGR
jgi:hypothetical protein